ncbi:DUF6318 family protein [Jatrophihabitans telluris]|uniref:DUF6318 family protein n=1 Tax=Jatrophihabitans telluris TaxID=2038343 RepID=A0ABY4QVT5_9ACTN|nr:DUF6318 family protein [Jatrophihabitans telluris]UQX87610.1 DUF6318 family protein [Jatrophihabitans telluris]
MDQIPPGRPAEWVPAGVSTTAPFRETGDVLPRFNLAMFTNDQAGAVAASKYYLSASNWSLASNSASATEAICDDATCRSNAEVLRSHQKRGYHFEGGRQQMLSSAVFKSDDAPRAEWIVQIGLKFAATVTVNAQGVVVKVEPAGRAVENVYLRWSGSMWRVSGLYLAGRRQISPRRSR